MESSNDQLMESKLRSAKNDKIHLWIKTLSLVAVWVVMGMSQVMLSATMPDVRARLGADVEEISRALAIGAVGSMIGAPLGSLADRFHNKVDLIISGCLFVCAVTIGTRCLTTSLTVFSINIFVDGLTWTLINAVGNSLLMDLWGDKGSTPMHALHFGYPLGAMIGPLIAYPFVSVEQQSSNYTNVTTTEDAPFTSDSKYPDDSQIEIPYGIVACLIAVASLTFAIYQLTLPSAKIATHQNKQGYKWADVFSPSKWAGEDSHFGVVIIIMMMTFFALHVITLKASTSYYTTYAVDMIGYTNQEATLYTSITSFCATAGRAMSILCAYFIPIQVMLITEVHGQAFFAIVTLIWGLDDKLLFLIFSCLFMFFREPIWPSAYTWTDQYIALYAIVVGLLDLSAKSADALFSWLLGYLYTYTVEESLFYNTVAAGVLLCVLTIMMNYIAERHGRRIKGGGEKHLVEIVAEEICPKDEEPMHYNPCDNSTYL